MLVREYVVHRVLGEDYTGPIFLHDAVWNIIDLIPDEAITDDENMFGNILEDLKGMKTDGFKEIRGIPVDCVEIFEEYADIKENEFEYSRVCTECNEPMDEGHYCEGTGEYFCSVECLTKNLDACGLEWRWDEEENDAGGYITQFEKDGTPIPCDIFYTEWH